MEIRNMPKFLRQLRHDKELTQGQLAKALGVTSTMISFWENGHQYPSKKNRERIIRYAKRLEVLERRNLKDVLYDLNSSVDELKHMLTRIITAKECQDERRRRGL